MPDSIQSLLEAVRRHIRSFEPGTLIGSELNVACHLRELDGDVWAPWCEPGQPEAEDFQYIDMGKLLEEYMRAVIHDDRVVGIRCANPEHLDPRKVTPEEAKYLYEMAERMIRPSYVLGGFATEIIDDAAALEYWRTTSAPETGERMPEPIERPITGPNRDMVGLLRQWAIAFDTETCRSMTVAEIACLSGDDLPGDLRAAADALAAAEAERDGAMQVVEAARYVNDPANWREVGVGDDGHPTWQFSGDMSRLGEALEAYDAALEEPT